MRVSPSAEIVRRLTVFFKSKPISWLTNFFLSGGLKALTEHIALTKERATPERLEIQFECVNCLRYLLHTKPGIERAPQDKFTASSLIAALLTCQERTKPVLFFNLAMLCQISEESVGFV